jgi:hypothetical protein
VAIRSYYQGDDAQQVAIYNAAAAALPGFKPATLVEVQRRIRAKDFDPTTRLYAEEDGRLVGYITFHANGRISYPWCLPGHERWGAKLFQEAMQNLRQRGARRIFAAYRGDWGPVHVFFQQQGFKQVREMVNFTVDFFDLPTPPLRVGQSLMPVTKADVPAILKMVPQALRVTTPQALTQHLFDNPYFRPEALFALRSRSDGNLRAVGILIQDPTYADPNAVDSQAPCFRLGAFGTEGMQTKRIKGLFSFLARLEKDLPAVAIDLLTQATSRLRDNDDISCLAAQCPSDVPELLGFYQRYFRRQGSFPVFERDLT